MYNPGNTMNVPRADGKVAQSHPGTIKSKKPGKTLGTGPHMHARGAQPTTSASTQSGGSHGRNNVGSSASVAEPMEVDDSHDEESEGEEGDDDVKENTQHQHHHQHQHQQQGERFIALLLPCDASRLSEQ
jgi:hypothetical protein